MLGKLRAWYRTTFGYGMVGALFYWAALPPLDRLGLWPLGWIAPLWWVLLIRYQRLPCAVPAGQAPAAVDCRRQPNDRHQQPNRRQASGRRRNSLGVRKSLAERPYLVLWIVGFFFWMLTLHWLRLPHWATSFGWVALSVYLACYLPVFVALTRVAVHRLGVPVIVAAPVVWTGLELARGHLLTGFTMASLGHTQYRWICLIQVSDLAGAYGVSFVVMFVAACIARMVPLEGRRWCFWPLVPAGLLLAAALVYGDARIGQLEAASGEEHSPVRVGLVQGSFDVVLKPPPGTNEKIHARYLELSQQAIKRFGQLDLVIWPETVYGTFLIEHAAVPAVPEWWKGDAQQFRRRLRQVALASIEHLRNTAEMLGVAMIVGITRQFWGADGPKVFNSAAFVPLDGRPILSYDKMHLVMFGEYVPFAKQLRPLVQLTPLSTLGLATEPGNRPMSFELRGVRFSPNICYESVMPQVIRRQVRSLAAAGREPHVLVNLTNDGWFWGSSELDMHLVCGVFRAVEARKPLLIAANTGISAWIDCCGRIIARGPRRDEALLLAEMHPLLHHSWYMQYGDVPAGACLAFCIATGCVGCWNRWRTGRRRQCT